MLDSEVVNKLKERYQGLHPLIFHRSTERAKTLGELFDILEGIPKSYPIVWCDKSNKWVKEYDLFLTDAFFIKK